MEGQSKESDWKEAEKLVEFIWFPLSFHFARRGREEWRELTRQSFGIKQEKKGWLWHETFTSPKNVLNKQKITNEVLNSLSSHMRMFVCTKIQVLLIQWLRLNFTSARLILTANKTPNKATTKNINSASVQHWYRNDTLGKNTINKMMQRISITAELSERYTNHCICTSTVTSLFQHGVDARKICAITKHKDERSLTHYINKTKSAQKQENSDILSETFQSQLAVQQEASGIMKQM